MKAKLEFNIKEPEDLKAFKRAALADEMAIVLFEAIHNLEKRARDKFQTNKNKLSDDVLDEYLMMLLEELEDKGIVVDNITD